MAHGRIVLANPAAAQLLGYTRAQLTGLNVDALVPATVAARHEACARAIGATPRPRPMGNEMELAARRADGTEVMVEIALSPLQVGHAHSWSRRSAASAPTRACSRRCSAPATANTWRRWAGWRSMRAIRRS